MHVYRRVRLLLLFVILFTVLYLHQQWFTIIKHAFEAIFIKIDWIYWRHNDGINSGVDGTFCAHISAIVASTISSISMTYGGIIWHVNSKIIWTANDNISSNADDKII